MWQSYSTAFRAVCRVRLTNKTPAATYRAPGRFESTFVRERLMDAAAEKLGLERIEIRRRNLIPATAMPYTLAYDEPGVHDLELDSGDYTGLLDNVAIYAAALTDVQVAGQSGPWLIQRPKVVYNSHTETFVMWFHLDDEEYKSQKVGVATSQYANGRFAFVKALQPDGLVSTRSRHVALPRICSTATPTSSGT